MSRIFFCEENRDVIRHITSFLSHDDWRSTQKTAKLFRCTSEDEIVHRKQDYMDSLLTHALSYYGQGMRPFCLYYTAIIRHPTLFTTLITVKHSEQARFIAIFHQLKSIPLKLMDIIDSQIADDVELQIILEKWKCLATSIETKYHHSFV